MNPLEMQQHSKARIQNQMYIARRKYIGIRWMIIFMFTIIGLFVGSWIGGFIGFIVGCCLG